MTGTRPTTLLSFQPNFQRREIQHLWNLEVIELRLLSYGSVGAEERDMAGL